MKIEDYWKDGTEYYVQFETETHRFIEKTIILPVGITLEQAKNIVMTSFNNIKRVVVLEERVEILAYKSI